MRKLTPAAEAAKMIRAELKKTFPNVKFSVTSENYSMGDSVRINWTDGVTTEQVNEIVKKYQYGHFDGMTDCYEFSNNREDIPQAKFVMTTRNYSDEIRQQYFDHAKKTYKAFEKINCMNETSKELHEAYDCWTASNFIYRLLVKKDLTAQG